MQHRLLASYMCYFFPKAEDWEDVAKQQPHVFIVF